MEQNKPPVKLIVAGVCLVAVLLLAVFLGGNIVETNAPETYQIKQAAITGAMSAKMDPGMWMQWFGNITTWPKAETFFFTADSKEGHPFDQSIEVMFNDGSACKISGTCRVAMPRSEAEAIELVMKHGFRNHDDVENKLLLPVIRNALNRTANLMSARESYSEKRPEYVNWAWDQVQNGLYEIDEEVRKEKDPVSGDMVTKIIKVIRRDEKGNVMRQANPFHGTGITLSNFEIKNFVYSDKVREQIAAQQQALMAVATARANAQKAEQDALPEEAKGKAEVMKAKYEEEQKKVRAVVEATKEKEVAETAAAKELSVAKLQKQVGETNAQREVEVAKLQRDAAEANKQKNILDGQGESEKKRMIMEADGALKQKLDAYIEVNRLYADAIAKYQGHWVPSVVMGPSNQSGSTNGAQSLIDMLTAKTAKDLALDLEVKGQKDKK